MKTSEQRINNIIGQLEGVKKMLQTEKTDCFLTLTQLKAVRSAVASLMECYLTDELEHCLTEDKAKDRELINKFFKEIIKR